MDAFTRIDNALADLGYPIRRDWISDEASAYFVFSFGTEPGSLYADDRPLTEDTNITLHFFAPAHFNPASLIPKVKRRIFKAGFSWPSSMSVAGSGSIHARQAGSSGGADHRHIIFEFSRTDFIARHDEE